MNDFTSEEIAKILKAKHTIKKNLEDFNLSIGKLGVNVHLCYFVSGGCVASLLQDEIPKDYDIYFRTQFEAERVIDLYTKDPSYQNEVAVYEEKYRDTNLQVGAMVITENAVTLKNGLQLITKHYGTPEEIRKTFDFVHCMPYYNTENDKLYISREQYDCCVKKVLRVNNENNVTHWRKEKFESRGYTHEKWDI
jgi:hypothetical protein